MYQFIPVFFCYLPSAAYVPMVQAAVMPVAVANPAVVTSSVRTGELVQFVGEQSAVLWS